MKFEITQDQLRQLMLDIMEQAHSLPLSKHDHSRFENSILSIVNSQKLTPILPPEKEKSTK